MRRSHTARRKAWLPETLSSFPGSQPPAFVSFCRRWSLGTRLDQTLPVVFYKHTLSRMRIYMRRRRSGERIRLPLKEGYKNSAPVAVPGQRVTSAADSSLVPRKWPGNEAKLIRTTWSHTLPFSLLQSYAFFRQRTQRYYIIATFTVASVPGL